MVPGEWKPVLAALVLPPAGPLLLAAFGVLVATRRRALGLTLALAGIVVAWALSTNAVAQLLASRMLQGVQPVSAQDLQKAEAIVVLGGGVLPQAPEYGVAQPGAHTLARIRYGAWLAKRTGKPLGFAGGIGWAAAGTATESEGAVARRVLQEEYGLPLRWLDDQSRDTLENAARMAALLRPAGVRRIALVTDATHMERAAVAFRAQGLEVLPAPTLFPAASSRPVLEWLPSVQGADTCRQLLREWLGRRFT